MSNRMNFTSKIDRARIAAGRIRQGYFNKSYAQDIERSSRKAGKRVGGVEAPQLSAFWFRSFPNFGDFLTPWLTGQMGAQPIFAEPGAARVVAVGSLLEMLPDDFEGHVWGTGSMYGTSRLLPGARWQAVRGELTREAYGVGDVALGDPGLLASRFMIQFRKRWKVGLIPHRVHRAHEAWKAAANRPDFAPCRVIDVTKKPDIVMREIAECDFIVSSSLHGIVIADGFGIPAVRARLSESLKGGDFKFDDHSSAVRSKGTRVVDESALLSRDFLVENIGRADATSVAERQSSLLRAYSKMLDDMGPLRGNR